MSQQTISLPKTTIEQMKKHYAAYLETAPQWAVFRAKTPAATITAYASGKVLFQGKEPEAEMRKWAGEQSAAKKKQTKQPVSSKYTPPAHLFTSSHIGSDESGTGDYFGPITTCAIYIKEDQIKLLKEIGIQDSKAITDDTILLLSSALLEMDIPYSLMILHNEKYNQLQQQGWSQGKMKTMLHDACIKKVKEKITHAPLEGILIDQFCQPNIYIKHLATENRHLDPHTYFITKAENHSIAVAAASILARASFVREMERLSEWIDQPLLKGASQKVDQLIAKIIREHGTEVLHKIAKVHFANTKKAQQLLKH